MHSKEHAKQHLTPFNIVILVLSLYILVSLIVDTFAKLPPETSRVLNLLDYAICFVFFIDFLIQFFSAKDKLAYMKWGWIDLISCIPLVDVFQAGRLVRVIRLIRVIRAFRSIRSIALHIFASRIRGTFTTVAVVAVLMIIFSAIAILQVEDVPESNIKTAEDALWWSYVTITTVGYGDKFPVTTAGRVIAAALMTVGVGLFGTFTAFVASWFVDENEDEREEKGKQEMAREEEKGV